jgi:predicted alpha/beta hydrolase family esterase
MSACLLHGKPDEAEYFDQTLPSPSNSHWIPWLQKQLLLAGVMTYTPEMPRPFAPNYQDWSREFARLPHTEITTYLGHSAGGGFLLRWLAERESACQHLILVAPWLDPDQLFEDDFFAGALNHVERARRIDLLISADDSDDVQRSVAEILAQINDIRVHRFHGYGHFTKPDRQISPFPELRDIILGEGRSVCRDKSLASD